MILFPIFWSGQDTDASNFNYGLLPFWLCRPSYSSKTSYNIDVLKFRRFRHEIVHDLLSALVLKVYNSSYFNEYCLKETG